LLVAASAFMVIARDVNASAGISRAKLVRSEHMCVSKVQGFSRHRLKFNAALFNAPYHSPGPKSLPNKAAAKQSNTHPASARGLRLGVLSIVMMSVTVSTFPIHLVC